MKNGENRYMASRALSKPNAKNKAAAARKIAAIIEEHMNECGLSEAEKNKRVQSFGKRVDRAIRLRAKRS